MNKTQFDPNDPSKCITATHEIFKGMQSTLNGILDEVPAQFKEQIGNMKKKVDEALVKLADQPTDQVPAAEQAAFTIRRMADSLSMLKDLYDGSVEQLKRLTGEIEPQLTQLNELNQKVENGELLDTTKVKEQVDNAVNEALQKERDRVALLNQRRNLLAEANLPSPAEEKTLEGEEKEFSGLQETAKQRLKTLEDKGMRSQLNTADLADLLYGDQANFDRAVKMAAALSGQQVPAGRQPEPLAGAGTGGGGNPGGNGKRLRGF